MMNDIVEFFVVGFAGGVIVLFIMSTVDALRNYYKVNKK